MTSPSTDWADPEYFLAAERARVAGLVAKLQHAILASGIERAAIRDLRPRRLNLAPCACGGQHYHLKGCRVESDLLQPLGGEK
jgi:hypothetical protein